MAIEDLPDEYLDTVLEDGLTIREHMEISLKKSLEYEKNSPNPKFHRTDEEKEKSFIFQQKYTDKISFFENKIYSNHIYKMNNKFDIIMSLIKCNRAISYYNKLKKFCYKNDGEIYFQDMWEYCHNSQQACFPYVSQLEETKKELIDTLKKDIDKVYPYSQKNVREAIMNNLKKKNIEINLHQANFNLICTKYNLKNNKNYFYYNNFSQRYMCSKQLIKLVTKLLIKNPQLIENIKLEKKKERICKWMN